MSKKRIPAELLFEICHSLPFRLRWATDRVALAFDHFVLKIQCVWMKAEFRRQIKIEQKKQLLIIAKRELSKVTKKLLDDELSSRFESIAFNFQVDFDFGVEGMDLRGMTSFEIFNKKLEKILAERVDYEDPNSIVNAVQILVCQINFGLIFIYNRTDFPNGPEQSFLHYPSFALALHKHSDFKHNEPSSLAAICELVAAFMDCPAHELANATTANAQRVFGLELEDNHHQQQQEQQQQCNDNENDDSPMVN
ncbi:hypothetical protein niasHS_012537 [Heterodera schachtii]|uniref:Uncharacterized protein n=2 Tax=Heterodera TaxID=34509 RepID=A0ABD2ICK1_HETSC